MHRILLTGKSGAAQIPRCCRYFLYSIFFRVDPIPSLPEERSHPGNTQSSLILAPSAEAAFMAAI